MYFSKPERSECRVTATCTSEAQEGTRTYFFRSFAAQFNWASLFNILGRPETVAVEQSSLNNSKHFREENHRACLPECHENLPSAARRQRERTAEGSSWFCGSFTDSAHHQLLAAPRISLHRLHLSWISRFNSILKLCFHSSLKALYNGRGINSTQPDAILLNFIEPIAFCVWILIQFVARCIFSGAIHCHRSEVAKKLIHSVRHHVIGSIQAK